MNPEEKIENIRVTTAKKELAARHYYGDKVRTIYISIAIIILIMTPFFRDRIPFPEFLSVFGAIILSMFAGFTNPNSKMIILFDFIISISALFIFGYEMLKSFYGNIFDPFFIGNVLLSIMSLFAIYYSSKTLRGILMHKDTDLINK